MYSFVLLRHGQSTWNLENRFTGWTDVELTGMGRQEAHQAARSLIEAGFTFDIAFTSVLKRAIQTLWIVLEGMNLKSIPVVTAWQLNERHYGALQSLSKADIAFRHGEELVMSWRRSYTARPPALEFDDSRHPRFDRLYDDQLKNGLPRTESLVDTQERLLPFWIDTISPFIKSGQRALVSAHGNSLRALVKHLDEIPDEEFLKLNIPTGLPLVYELDVDLHPIRGYYLDNQ